MNKLMIGAAAMLAISVTACKKTGEGEFEVEKPVVGTVTDTVHTPSVDVKMESTTVKLPDVDVKTQEKTIKVPDVDVKKPQ
jgi:hypothetical protein